MIQADLRPLFGGARDQGRRPTCVAFAASDCHAAERSTVFEALSVEYAFYRALLRKGGALTPNSGARLSDMLDAIRIDGQPVEAAWPYLPTLPSDLSGYKPPPGELDLFRRESKRSGASIDQIWNALQAGKPPLVVFMPTIQFHLAQAGRIIRAHKTEPPTGAAHAVIAIASGLDGSERVIYVRNSWGNKWAESGCAWVAESYLAPRLKAVATME